MTIETPVSPNRCAEFLDARQRGEVKGRVEWQDEAGLWCETISTASHFRDWRNPDTPRGGYRIVHEPAPVKVPALDAVRGRLTILRAEGRPREVQASIVAHEIKAELGSLVVFDQGGFNYVPIDSDGMVEVLPDEPEPDAYRDLRNALSALLDGHRARSVPGSDFEVVDRSVLQRDGGASLVLVDRLGCHYHTAQSLTDEARDGLVIADPPDEPRRVTVELSSIGTLIIDGGGACVGEIAVYAPRGTSGTAAKQAIRDALRCSDSGTSDEREGER